MNRLHNTVDAAAIDDVRYATGDSILGKILVAKTDRGICAILIGDDVKSLEADLRQHFSKATLSECGDMLGQLMSQVNALIESPRRGFDQQLDLGGTAFQQKVWKALRDIPAGTTASYTDIATSLGRPDAVRAVAGACAANILALAIPCHRVIRRDGNISGYRWGVERKRTLLQREALV